MTSKNKVILICGPTASGKTSLGVSVAEEFGGEVISADSRQFYREMKIGTARPSKDELRGIKHHFIGSHSIEKPLSAGDFERGAIKVVESIFQRGKIPIVVGGSGLYIDALLQGLDDLPFDPEIRNKYRAIFNASGIESLKKKLDEIDPTASEILDVQNPVRIIRALELIELTGKPLQDIRRAEQKPPRFPVLGICLSPDRELLYEKINLRVEKMIAEGLLEEAKALLPFRNSEALQTVGYRELFPYFDGEKNLDEAISLIKRNTRRYAKRQLTWFRRKDYLAWFSPTRKKEIFDLIEKRYS